MRSFFSFLPKGAKGPADETFLFPNATISQLLIFEDEEKRTFQYPTRHFYRTNILKDISFYMIGQYRIKAKSSEDG